MVPAAQQDQVLEGVPLFIGLRILVSRTTRALGLDVADLPGDGAGALDERKRAPRSVGGRREVPDGRAAA
jgi:hypothetical protein